MSDRPVPRRTDHPTPSEIPDRSVRQRTGPGPLSTSPDQGGTSDSPPPSRGQTRQQNNDARATSESSGPNRQQNSSPTASATAGGARQQPNIGTAAPSRSSSSSGKENVHQGPTSQPRDPTPQPDTGARATSPPRAANQQQDTGATATSLPRGVAQPPQVGHSPVPQRRRGPRLPSRRSESAAQGSRGGTVRGSRTSRNDNDLRFTLELAMKISPKSGTVQNWSLATFVKELAQSHNTLMPRSHGYRFSEKIFALEEDNEPCSWRFVAYRTEPYRSQPPVTLSLASPNFSQDEDFSTAIRSALTFLTSKCTLIPTANYNSVLHFAAPDGFYSWTLPALKRLSQAIIQFEPVLPPPPPGPDLQRNWQDNPLLTKMSREEAMFIVESSNAFRILSMWLPLQTLADGHYVWSIEGHVGTEAEDGTVMYFNLPPPADVPAILRRVALVVAFVRASSRYAGSRYALADLPPTAEGLVEYLGLLGNSA